MGVLRINASDTLREVYRIQHYFRKKKNIFLHIFSKSIKKINAKNQHLMGENGLES